MISIILAILVHPQICVDDALIVLNFRRNARGDLTAKVDDIDPVGNVHDQVHVVLDEEDGEPKLRADLADERGQLLRLLRDVYKRQILLVVLAVAFYLDAKLPSYHIAIKVI